MSLTFEEFSQTNRARCHEWMGKADTLHHHTIGLAGEVGELCNVVKKMDRVANGRPGVFPPAPEDIAGEVADVLIYLDLVAMHLGVDLETALVAKFNATSRKYGFPQQLPEGGS
jgi:NTP pyrophosphatase (non-canonical NTP hydrolase)